MPVRKPFIAAALLCAVAACGAEQKPIIPSAGELSPQIRFTEAGRKQTMLTTAPLRVETLRGGQITPEAAESGAECTLETVLWTATVTTPARLAVPSYGAAGPELTVTCRKDGRETSATRRNRNLTELAYANRAAGHMVIGFGLVGAAVTAGQASGRDKAQDVWGYEPISIPLR